MSKRSKSTSEPGPKRKKKSEPGRLTANLGVGIVAITAAVISFTHVQHLAQDAGETELAALLLPLSVDGAIAAAAAVVLAESKAKRKPPVLAWIMLILGLIASLGANIASAEPTLTARLIAAWPPIALALGIEVIAAVSRRAREERDAEAEDLAPAPALTHEKQTVVAAPAPQHRAPAQPTGQPAHEPIPVQPAPAPVVATVVAPSSDTPGQEPQAAQPSSVAEAVPASAASQPAVQPAVAAVVAPSSNTPDQAQVRQPGPVAARTAAAGRPSRAVQATARTGAHRPANELSDDDAIEVIRRLDAESDTGPVSRRTIETALRCGATRATRLALLARAADRVPELAGQAS
ncbi:DUF2637 domain-containing protein [Cellulosimicrobium cellulans]|uniref:DUF2637 domain-containing protein n=1 Tax=Cellulosimicrobium cellulans TaxID=1710 RepID=UPI0037F4C752